MVHRRPRQCFAAGAALAAVLGLVGCSDGEEPKGTPAGATDSGTPAPSDSGDPTPSAGDQEVAGTVPDVGEPVATRTITQDGNSYRLDVFPLAFDQGDPGVSANVRLVFEEMTTPAVRPGLLASQEDQGSIRVRRASGLQVVDRAGGTAYLPALDADGMPLCSPEVPAEARTGDMVYVTCVFGGLGEEVETLDLVVPTFGTFRDVSAQ